MRNRECRRSASEISVSIGSPHSVLKDMRRSALLLLASTSLASAPALFAQSDSSPSVFSTILDSSGAYVTRADTRRGCFDSIAPETMHREKVYLRAEMPAHTDSMFLSQSDLMAQDVAAEVRTLLGAHGVDIPVADRNMAWYVVPSALTVVAHADGHVTRHFRSALWDTTAAALLAQAFDTARAHDMALMLWPQSSASDSVVVRLSLAAEDLGEKSPQFVAAAPGMRFAVFSLLQPETFPAVPLPNQPPANYPPENESSRVSGTVVMQLVVDTSGRAIPGSIRDLWPAKTPRLKGYEAQEYDAFVRSTTSWLKNIRFRPARIGTCLVSQMVQQPLEFKVVRP
jgi:hypothetical protein